MFRSVATIGILVVAMLFGAAAAMLVSKGWTRPAVAENGDAMLPADGDVEEETSLLEGDSNADDVAPKAKNPLIRGLERALDDNPVEHEELDKLREGLTEADEALSRIKSENLAAIREVNRQVRIGGPRPVNILLLVVEGLDVRDLSCYGAKKGATPAIDQLAAEGVRWTACRAPKGGLASLHTSIVTGVDPPPGGSSPSTRTLPSGETTLGSVLWKAGYTTAVIGDCSLAGTVADGNPGQYGFETWYGFRRVDEAHNAYPEKIWDKTASMRVLANAEGKKGNHAVNLLLTEVVNYCYRHRSGRPFFLYFAWSLSEPDSVSSDATTHADRGVAAILEHLEKTKLDNNTIVLLVGDRSSSTGEAKDQESFIPLIVWGPTRGEKPRTCKQACRPCDLFPTIIELSGASRRAPAHDGRSMTKILRAQP